MANPKQSFSDILDMLNAQNYARVDSYGDNKILGQKELVRRFADVTEGHEEKCVRCLNLFTDVKNTSEQRWIQDPWAGKEKHPGKWRLVSNNISRDPRRPGIIQTLRLGFATVIAWDEARLANADAISRTQTTAQEGTNADEEYLTVIFPSWDPTTIETAKAGLLAARTVVDPVIQGHTYTGTWYYLHVRSDEQEDGSQSIFCLLAQPRSFLQTYERPLPTRQGETRTMTVYYCWHVPKWIAQSVVDDAAYDVTGSEVSANYRTDRGTVDLIIRQSSITRDNSVTILDVKTRDECMLEEYTSYYYGYTKAEAEAFDLGDAPQGWVYSAPSIQEYGFQTYRIRVVKTKAIEKSVDSYNISDTVSSTVARKEDRNQTTVPSIGSYTQGILKRARSVLNRFCVFNNTVDTITSKAGEESFSITVQSGFTEQHKIKWNQTTISFGSLASGKERKLVSFSRNEDGTFNWYTIDRDVIALGYPDEGSWISYFPTEFRNNAGTVQYRDKLQITYVKYHNTFALAVAEMNAAGNFDWAKGISRSGRGFVSRYNTISSVGSWANW